MNKRQIITSAVLLFIAIILILTPIKMGKEANKNIPIIGAVENASEEYTKATLVKATAAYGVTKLVNKTISVIQETDISASLVAVGVTAKPGQLLASANEALDRVANALFLVMSVLLVQNIFIGMISFLSLKCLLPLGLIFLACAPFLKNIFPSMRTLGSFMVRFALIAWLVFPLSAYISKYIESSYIHKEFAYLEKQIEINSNELELSTNELNSQIIAPESSGKKEQDAAENVEEKVTNTVAESKASPNQEITQKVQPLAPMGVEVKTEDTSWLADIWSSISYMYNATVNFIMSLLGNEIPPHVASSQPAHSSDKDDGWFTSLSQGASNTFNSAVDGTKNFFGDMADGLQAFDIAGTAERMLNYLDNIIDALFVMLAIFILTTIVIPMGVYFVIAGLFRAMKNDATLQQVKQELLSLYPQFGKNNYKNDPEVQEAISQIKKLTHN